VVVVRAAVHTLDTGVLQRSSQLAEVAAGDGDVIDVGVCRAQKRAPKKNAAGDASGGVESKSRRRTWQFRRSTGPNRDSHISERPELSDYFCIMPHFHGFAKNHRF
jgi:hypothetical protein